MELGVHTNSSRKTMLKSSHTLPSTEYSLISHSTSTALLLRFPVLSPIYHGTAKRAVVDHFNEISLGDTKANINIPNNSTALLLNQNSTLLSKGNYSEDNVYKDTKLLSTFSITS